MEYGRVFLVLISCEGVELFVTTYILNLDDVYFHSIEPNKERMQIGPLSQ